MILSTFAFAAMHACVRHLSSELHPLQIAFFRNFFGLIVFLPLVMRSGVGFLRTTRFGLHSLRAVLNVISMFMFFYALAITPLARVTALSFTAPIFAAVLGVIILGERFRLRRWSAIAAGFIGTIVILRPGMIEVDVGSILVVVSAALWGLTLIIIKILGRTESSMTITGYMNLLLSVLSLAPAIYYWQTPTLIAWVLLVAIAVLGTLGQLLLAESLRQADTTVVLPFDFLKLVWAAVLGYLFFAELPDALTWVGAAIVFASGFYIAYRERVVRGR